MRIEAKANTKEVLQFIKDAEFVQSWELANEFGYTRHGAEIKIYILHKRHLIDNPIYGRWNLTTEGLRRLDYYNAKDNEKKTGIRKHDSTGVIAP